MVDMKAWMQDYRAAKRQAGYRAKTLWLYPETIHLLEDLAHQRGQEEADIIDAALRAYQPPAASGVVSASLRQEIQALIRAEMAAGDRTQPPAIPRSPREAMKARIIALHHQGLSVQAIVDSLNADHTPTLSGRGRWGKGTVGALLREALAAEQPQS
jgi:hypothetical protein